MSIPWKQYYERRKAAKTCVRCGVVHGLDRVYCESCAQKNRDYQKQNSPRISAMKYMVAHHFNGSPMEKLFSFIVRGGKIQPKEAK